jgi:hypothetical protein
LYEFFNFELLSTEPTVWTTWPTRYKIMSMKIQVNLNRIEFKRTSYNLLNLVADVGGLKTGVFMTFTLCFG